MVSIVTKKIKGNEYLYLVGSERKQAHVQQKTIKYIGKKRPVPEEEFACQWRMDGHVHLDVILEGTPGF
jgi:hypothetical protein